VEDVMEVQLSCLLAQQALGRGGAFFDETLPLERNLRDFVDLVCEEAGLIEFPLEAASGIEGDREEAIVGGELAAPVEEAGQVRVEKLKEIPAFSEFDFVEDFLDGVLIAKEGPPLVSISQVESDPFLGREESHFLKVIPTVQAEAFFFQLKESSAGRAETWIKKPQEGLPITGKNVLRFHGGLLYRTSSGVSNQRRIKKKKAGCLRASGRPTHSLERGLT